MRSLVFAILAACTPPTARVAPTAPVVVNVAPTPDAAKPPPVMVRMLLLELRVAILKATVWHMKARIVYDRLAG